MTHETLRKSEALQPIKVADAGAGAFLSIVLGRKLVRMEPEPNGSFVTWIFLGTLQDLLTYQQSEIFRVVEMEKTLRRYAREFLEEERRGNVQQSNTKR